ncbi:MAG: enoyl-[acyl-carrier-protein] reductase FabK [Clostridiales bacterium]|nr:enoyl-[acyl-carrier-protein] reductase FabK [Clostridiales bacterium]
MRYPGTICALTGTQYPLIQGGMAWVSDASLAAAVSMAGGLGVIAAGNAPPDWVERQVTELRAKTDKPFGLNVMLLSPYVAQVAELAADLHVPVVITGAGNPDAYVKRWKAAGCLVAPVVASRALAMLMERMGADFVIAEGCEAGGHIGELTSMVLWPDIARSVSIPVVAAGGVFDASGVAAAFCLGAKGVQVGTRFILAEECTAHEAYKERVLRAKDIDSKVTGRITGHPVRVLRSPLQRELATAEYGPDGAAAVEKLGEGSLMRAVLHGDKDRGSFMAGQCACMMDRIQPAEAIVRELFDAELIVRALSGASAMLEANE